jgi:DNA-binding IclR family transcriptional regulator
MTRADRLHLVLRLFTVERPVWTIEDAAAALGVSISTVYRQFGALVRSGLLEALEEERSYVLGPAIIEMDRNIRLSDPLTTVATSAMRWLAEQTPVACAVLLCRLYRERVMCIHQEEKGEHAIRVSYERGRPMPLSRGAPSKTILSQLSTRRLSALAAQLQEPSEQTVLCSPEFRRELAVIRKQGFAVTRGEVDAGVIGVAVPLATPLRGIVVSLGVACFEQPNELIVARVRALLTATAATIGASIQFGGSDAQHHSEAAQ